MERLKIFIVEDNKSFREGIILYLEKTLNHQVCGYASDGMKFLEQKEKHYSADVILMDIQMPNLNGILATKRYLLANHTQKVIAVTAFQTNVGLLQLISAGFKACVFKNRIYEELPDAIDAVINGKRYYPKSLKMDVNGY
jgi:DNA-binding NarL/FixJ family response regulator